MSRCFPFPPPGYEKKAKIDDTDLLTKEKHKEKKHKKDKKDKEKREDKEKDKDRSKEKHKEKKDRKDKHRDKDKHKDKEKKQTSDEKRVEGQTSGEKRIEGQTSGEKRVEEQTSNEKRIEGHQGIYNGEKFGSNSLQNNEIKDSKYLQELARRIRDEDRASGSQMVQKVVATDQRKAEQWGMSIKNSIGNQSNKRKAEPQGVPVENSFGNQSHQRNPEPRRMPVENHIGNQPHQRKAEVHGMLVENSIGNQSIKRKAELRGMPVENQIGNQSYQRKAEVHGMLVENSIGNHSNKRKAELWEMSMENGIVNQSDQRKAELRAMPLENGNQSGGKKEVKDKIEDHRKVNGQRNLIVARSLEKEFDHNLLGMDHERAEGVTKLVEKKGPESQTEGKEKIKHKEIYHKDDKHNSKDQEKRKSKDKNRDKEKKKEEKAKELSEPNKEQSKVKENGPKLKEHNKDPLDMQNIKQPDSLKLSSTSSAGEGNLGKRKELETNGYLLDNGNRPGKIPRALGSSHPIVENGRKLEQCQTATRAASEKQWPANNHRADGKEHKINGLIMPQGLNLCSTRPLSANKAANENGQASAKPPHPDIKYLSQILSVPKVEELPDFDDQDWLRGNNMHSLKTNRDSPGIEGTQQVWSAALRIESADISALPYVIPY